MTKSLEETSDWLMEAQKILEDIGPYEAVSPEEFSKALYIIQTQLDLLSEAAELLKESGKKEAFRSKTWDYDCVVFIEKITGEI